MRDCGRGPNHASDDEQCDACYALAAFERWWHRYGHWMYADKERAMDKWQRDGIVGLPDARGEV